MLTLFGESWRPLGSHYWENAGQNVLMDITDHRVSVKEQAASRLREEEGKTEHSIASLTQIEGNCV